MQAINYIFSIAIRVFIFINISIGISKVNSVTIEANEDEDEEGNKTESVDMVDNGLEAYVPESVPVEEDDNNLGLKKIHDPDYSLRQDLQYVKIVLKR